MRTYMLDDMYRYDYIFWCINNYWLIIDFLRLTSKLHSKNANLGNVYTLTMLKQGD